MTGALPELVTEVTARLHARGERMTSPRRAVLAVLASTPGHLSADAVQARADDGRLPPSTIYRVLDLLCDIGIVQHVHLGHGATAYHLSDAGGAHLHLECRSCGAVLDLPATLMDEVVARVAAEHGFVLDPAHTALSGACARCASSTT